jgi:hypothetical protein
MPGAELRCSCRRFEACLKFVHDAISVECMMLMQIHYTDQWWL